MSYEMILVDRKQAVGVITLNRPEALNALNNQLMDEVTDVLKNFEADDDIRAIVITGSEKAFAAGADIKEIQSKTYIEAYGEQLITANWEAAAYCRKPIIAAVAGYALGGGCELAMMCDFIVAAENAKFGQPEVKLGVIPGAGGTQRLTRFIGKAKAMDMVLTGRMMDAAEAERSGLVSRVVPTDDLMDEVMKIAGKITDLSVPTVMLAKESVDRSYETTLSEGIRFECRIFHSLFGTEDQKEGMAAFIEKRTAEFQRK